MQPLEYACLGFCTCLALVLLLYWGSVLYLDWFNRVHLPGLPSGLMTDRNGDVMRTFWVYNAEKKVAEMRFERVCAPSAPSSPPETDDYMSYPYYDSKGNLKP